MPNKNEMLLSAGFQRKGMCANVHYKPSCFHIFLHCICGINAPQHERNSLCDSKQKRSILTSDPQMICEAHSHPSQEKPCIMVRNAAFRALLSLLERMAKPLLGHSQTHLQKLFSWHWGHSETSRDGKPDCLCHSVMVWSKSIPPCMLSSLW